MSKAMQSCSKPLIYLITDRQKISLPGDDLKLASLAHFLEQALASGVELIQIRERDLSARELFSFAREIVQMAHRYGASVLINDRADVAVACGAGVHLTTRSMKAQVVRSTFGDEILIGVSTHSLEEVEEAEREGADFVVFGPVFETESKKIYGPPLGLGMLREVTARATIPVLALGGINLGNFSEALRAGAAGIAGISIFAESSDLAETIRRLKSQDISQTMRSCCG
jgi:thiamine-phosphate pyrophosphorylase